LGGFPADARRERIILADLFLLSYISHCFIDIALNLEPWKQLPANAALHVVRMMRRRSVAAKGFRKPIEKSMDTITHDGRAESPLGTYLQNRLANIDGSVSHQFP
jgi:hypothetical protein